MMIHTGGLPRPYKSRYLLFLCLNQPNVIYTFYIMLKTILHNLSLKLYVYMYNGFADTNL